MRLIESFCKESEAIIYKLADYIVGGESCVPVS